MPTTRIHPYVILGKVTLNGSAYRGAKIWVRDYTTTGTLAPAIDGITYYSTYADGSFQISLPDVEESYADGDMVRVYCETENGITSWSDVVVEISTGRSVINFSITSKSAMVDGCKSSASSDRKGGLVRSQKSLGLSDGLK